MAVQSECKPLLSELSNCMLNGSYPPELLKAGEHMFGMVGHNSLNLDNTDSDEIRRA